MVMATKKQLFRGALELSNTLDDCKQHIEPRKEK